MTRILGRPQGYAAGVPLKLVIREDVPYRSAELGLSPGVYEATWSTANNRWESGGAELNVVMPRWDMEDAIPLGQVSVFISRTDTGAVVGKYIYSPAEWVETGAGVFDLGRGAYTRAWVRTRQIDDLTGAAEGAALRAEAAAQNVTAATLDLSTERQRVEQALADTAQQQAQWEAELQTLEANLASGSDLSGTVDTQAQLPAAQPDGTAYVVLATGTVWRSTGGNWTDTGLGARPVSEVYAATTGGALKKARDASGPTYVLRGHSLMYGQDTTSGSTKPAVNGAPQTRSTQPTTDVYHEMLAYLQPSATVVNQAYPGDQTRHMLTRWAGAPVGDVMVLWGDTNDANNYNGDVAGPATIQDSQRRYARLIREASNQGAQVIAVGGSPIDDLVVGAINGLSAGPISQNVRAYWAAQREVALRAGAAATVDIAEVLQEHGEPWTDGIHLTPAAYTEVGVSLAALAGPYGVTPPKVGPGARIGPRLRAHVGGTVVQRGGATNNAVIRLTAGQVCVLPVQVESDCELHLDVFTDPDGFEGEATMVYALGRVPGKPGRNIRVTGRPNGLQTVRGHAYASGPRCVIVSCTQGTVEIDGFRFVSRPPVLVQPVGPAAPRLYRSQLAGQTVGRGGGWAAIVDPTMPITTVDLNGAPYEARVRLSVVLPDDGTSHGLLLTATHNTGAPYLIRSGYMVFRAGPHLYVREWRQDGVVRNEMFADKFPAGPWSGTLDVIVDNATLTVLLDGVTAGQIGGVLYRHYTVGVVTEGIYTVRALSVETL